jgi:hypothetical protein
MLEWLRKTSFFGIGGDPRLNMLNRLGRVLSKTKIDHDALNEAFDFILNDSKLRPVAVRYNLDKQMLFMQYLALRDSGFAVTRRGHFIALSALCYPESLLFIVSEPFTRPRQHILAVQFGLDPRELRERFGA